MAESVTAENSAAESATSINFSFLTVAASVIASDAGDTITSTDYPDTFTAGDGTDVFNLDAYSTDTLADFTSESDTISFNETAAFEDLSGEDLDASADFDAAIAAAFSEADAGNNDGIEAIYFTYEETYYAAVEATATGDETAATVMAVGTVDMTLVVAGFVA